MLSTVPTASNTVYRQTTRSRHAPMRVVTVGFMEWPSPRRVPQAVSIRPPTHWNRLRARTRTTPAAMTAS